MNDPKLDGSHDLKMVPTKRYIKYMVSLRCKLILREALRSIGLNYWITPHGAVEFQDAITQNQLDKLKEELMRNGLELLDENESMLIDRIINTIIEVIHYSDELPKLSFKEVIGEKLSSNHDTILRVFSDVKGISIMQFIILQKIERVKEMLLYDDLSLAEICEKLHYKNEHYLIAQFKKFTGLSPSYYKRLGKNRKDISREAV